MSIEGAVITVPVGCSNFWRMGGEWGDRGTETGRVGVAKRERERGRQKDREGKAGERQGGKGGHSGRERVNVSN